MEDAHAIGALSATQEFGVAIGEPSGANASDHVMVSMGETQDHDWTKSNNDAGVLDPIELVMSPAGNAQQVSHQARTTEGFAAVSVIDGRPTILMANTASLLCISAVNNSCLNSVAPRQAVGAWKGAGRGAAPTSPGELHSLFSTTQGAVMRSIVNVDEPGPIAR